MKTKVWVCLMILIPTSVSGLLLAIAFCSFCAPQYLVAAEHPLLAICCIVAGIVLLIPILTATVLWLVRIFFGKK